MRPALLLPIALLCPPDAWGDDEPLKLADTLVSANRQAEERDSSTSASTVFTRADIDRLQPDSVVDLLNRVPGVQVAQSGGRGSLPGIFVRGMQSSQTLVLVDGVRVATATSADSNLQNLGVDQIERVEVLRGARSAIHGADAMAGVIQIFTRRADQAGLQGRLHVTAGSDGHWQRDLGLSGANDDSRFALSAGLDESAGINRTHASFASDQDHDAYRNRSLSLTASHYFTDDLEAGITLLDNQGKNEYDNPFGRFDSLSLSTVGQKPYSDFQLSSFGTYVDARLTEHWKSRLELGHSENQETSRDTLSDEHSAFNTYRDSLGWQNTLHLDERNSLLAGVDIFQDRVTSSTAFAEDSRWNRAAFVQHSYRTDSFGTQVGWRRDVNQQFGGQNTWSAAVTWFVNRSNDLVLSYSEGFRAPTFNDLYYPGYSNPNLTPEHSKSYELQWRSRLSDTTRLETSLYRTELSDAIVLDSNFLPQNIGHARINGAEAVLRQQLRDWNSALSLAVIDPRDRDSGHTMTRRARRTLNWDLDRRFGALAVGVTWQAVSRSYNDASNQQRIGGYALMGLRSSWAVTPQVKVDLKVDNLLDRQYSRVLYEFDGQAYGYREQGRAWTIGLTWNPAL
ncbi:TonB-dependent receptor domain-containing protein [Pseudomonas eucalypticola]|uniref:TonB-dependent receptor n=1 Tax=Pseudomonas eucalypticola TaxID=2599595 RepID=A0A7D5I0E4_9PSED|nr:TonB-dependent receptor [Pseudomonas eucalypticola]QKZ06971.1 TonB-dependent receptor [Pseudomonas eucalypticola]